MYSENLDLQVFQVQIFIFINFFNFIKSCAIINIFFIITNFCIFKGKKNIIT